MCWSGKTIRTCGARATGPWWLRDVAWRSHPRPTGEGPMRLPGAHGASFEQSLTRALGGFVSFDPLETEPAFSHPRVSDAAGMCQAGVCGDAACCVRAARPEQRCGSNAAGGSPYRRQPVPAIRTKNPCPDPPRSGRPRADRGIARKLPARRYGACTPELTAFRRPELRQPRPSVGTEGWMSVARGGKGGENIGEIFWGKAGEPDNRSPTRLSKGPSPQVEGLNPASAAYSDLEL